MSLIGFRPAGKDERERGNRLFSERKYEEAAGFYSGAISKNQSDHSSFTNRALCYLKLEDWVKAVEDCQSAIQLQPSSIKAHFYLGQAQLQLENYQSAVDSLQTAHCLAREQKRNFGDDIAAALRLAKRKKWQVTEEKNLQKESSLQQLLKQLLDEYKEKQITEAVQPSLSQSDEKNTPVLRREEIEKEHAERLEELDHIFKVADEKRKDRDIPDYLCGKISFELMRDPCITPSGITYERSDIEEHLNRVGHFDPVTRKPLTVDQLIPNLAMKEVVDAFISENEWVENF